MDTAQWPQQGIVGVVKGSVESNQRVRPQKEQAILNCPRCNSTNTKFCYYNNYSLSQPRYFCKTCRRYWTEGGSLRNVPVGGGSRKNKRSSSSSSSSSSSNPTLPNSSSPTNLHPSDHMNINHGIGSSKLYQGGFMGPFGQAGSLFGAGFVGFQEMMRNGASIGGSSGYGGGRMEEEGDGRILFPFQDLKQGNVSNGDHGGQGDPTLFWNGVMGSGGGGVNGGGGGGSW